MASLYLYNFNNYYNRRYKVYDTLEEYGDVSFVETGTNFNFNPNDGVNTTIVLGRVGNPYNGTCDYAIYCDDNVNITSRWFIIEQPRNRQGQYTLTLRRDVLADNPSWMQADTFIEKCTLNKYSPFIYNSEDFSVNEIKTSQTPIYDETGVPWIIGFYATNLVMGAKQLYPRANYDISVDKTKADFLAEIEAKKYWKSNDYYYSFNQTVPFSVYNGLNVLTGETRYKNFSTNPRLTNLKNDTINTYVNSSLFKKSELDSTFKSMYPTQYDYDGLGSYVGKIIKLTDGYYVVDDVKETPLEDEDLEQAVGTDIWSYMNGSVSNTSLKFSSGTECNSYAVRVTTHTVKGTLVLSKTNSEQSPISFGIPNTAVDPADMPYRAFCMPYGNVLETGYDGDTLVPQIPSDPDLNLQIANFLSSFKATDTDAFELIDCQIVPYCPLPGRYIGVNPGGEIICYDKKIAFPIKQLGNTIGFMYALSTCSGAFQLKLDDPIIYGDTLSRPDIKVANQIEKYRICAGNYTSAFDLNVVKNGGLTGYNISFTYKPFDSYIRVAPIFNNLYGGNFKDSRGLICSGLSLAKANDAFNQYRLQNKYYQAVFDRQIENIEVQNKYQRIQQIVGTGVGAAGTGATIGITTGNVYAGLAAGTASLAGGLADYQISEALRNEALDFTKDNFGYQLQNIKAQPNTLSRTADFNADTQYVPFLEYYTCTEAEKEAFIQKLRYNGMTAMFIDKPINYSRNEYRFHGDALYEDLGYFKGVPIRLEEISDDYHMAKTVAEELNKGVYMK